MGIVLSLEQQKADINMIRSVRVAAMGPLGGIGDALFWFTLVPITAGITANMAINGSIAGPILFLLIFNIVQMALRFFLMKMCIRDSACSAAFPHPRNLFHFPFLQDRHTLSLRCPPDTAVFQSRRPPRSIRTPAAVSSRPPQNALSETA